MKLLTIPVALLLMLAFTGCASREHVQDFQSPDQKWVASVYRGNGGATTAYWPIVDLSKRDGSAKAQVFSGYADARVQVVWSSPTNMTIYCTPDCQSAKLKRTDWHGITISLVKSWDWLK